MKKTIIISSISLVAGILLVLFSYFVYTVIKIQQQTTANQNSIIQIVNFLNSQIDKTKEVTQ
jgi:Na+-transporting NADH:ubiquinone oxidoreductase subunit NqrC